MSEFISKLESSLSKILNGRYHWIDKAVLEVWDSEYSDNGKVIIYGIYVNDINIDYEEQALVAKFIGEFHSSLSTGGMYSNHTILPDGTKTSFPYFLHMPDLEHLRESIKLPIEIGDTVLMGKFKNKKTVVKSIEWNEKGDLMINGKSALRVRISKKKKKQKIKESVDRKQKYTEYVVNDLMSQITIDEEGITFPWVMSSLEYDYSDPETTFPFTYDEIMNITPFRSGHFNDMTMFEYYVTSKYGTKTNEVLGFWLKIKKKLIEMVKWEW
jgi:hypothetical protein